jgi:hypothetical protein
LLPLKAQRLLAILLFASLCQAEDRYGVTDGNSLLQGIRLYRKSVASLSREEAFEVRVKMEYLRGFLDCSVSVSEFDPHSPFKLPEHGIGMDQFIQVVEKFLSDNPQLLHLPSNRLLLAALGKNFPNPSFKKD